MIADNLVVERGMSAGDSWVTVEAASIRTALGSLREEGFTRLTFLTCVDHLADSSRTFPARYEVVYQLRNMDSGAEIRIRTFINGDPPHIESVSDLFGPANWDEREMYDLFGVVFDNHPDLTRILLPDDWVGHPLRRDHPVGGEVVDFSPEHEKWQTAPDKA